MSAKWSVRRSAVAAALVTGLTLALVLNVPGPSAAQYGPILSYAGVAPAMAFSYGAMRQQNNQLMMQQQMAAQELAAARYQIQSAQAALAYQQAELLRQQAIAAAQKDEDRVASLQPRFPVGGMPDAAGAAGAARLDQLFGGPIPWPANTPTGGNLGAQRAAAEEAISAVYQDYKANGWSSLASVVDARQKLRDFGRPALVRLRGRKATRRGASGLLSFLEELDQGLELMGTAPPPAPGD